MLIAFKKKLDALFTEEKKNKTKEKKERMFHCVKQAELVRFDTNIRTYHQKRRENVRLSVEIILL